jgi:flagellar motor switch protein FliM
MNDNCRTADHEEIDALFRAYQKQQETAGDSPAKPRILPGMRGPASRIAKQQVYQIGILHESFARNLAADLSGLLRAAVEARLIGVEEGAHHRLLNQMPKPTYWASVNLPPFDAAAILGLELSLAFPMLDLLLGGDGAKPAASRDITEIEEQVLEVVVGAICRKLEATWQPLLDLKFEFDRRQSEAAIPRVIPFDEKILALTLALGLPNAHGTLSFAFPAPVASVLLRKITEQYLTPKRRTPQAGSASLRERLKKSQFLAEMILPASLVQGRELMDLKAGEVLVLNCHANDPVLISVAGQTMFSASPVRVGMARGARVQQRLQPAADLPREIS